MNILMFISKLQIGFVFASTDFTFSSLNDPNALTTHLFLSGVTSPKYGSICNTSSLKLHSKFLINLFLHSGNELKHVSRGWATAIDENFAWFRIPLLLPLWNFSTQFCQSTQLMQLPYQMDCETPSQHFVPQQVGTFFSWKFSHITTYHKHLQVQVLIGTTISLTSARWSRF